MFQFKILFRLLRWPHGATLKSPLQNNEKTTAPSKIKV